MAKALYQKRHQRIVAHRAYQENRAWLEKMFPGIGTTTDYRTVAHDSDVLVLGIRHYLIDDPFSKNIRDSCKNKLVISLAAKKLISELESVLPYSRVARVRTGISLREDGAGYTLGQRCDSLDEEVIKYIFGPKALATEEKELLKF